MIGESKLLAGHDISSGGLVTTLLEMCFGRNDIGLEVDLTCLGKEDVIRKIFSEQPAVIIQVDKKYVDQVLHQFNQAGIEAKIIGKVIFEPRINLTNNTAIYKFDIHSYRDIWYATSYYLDQLQTSNNLATNRFNNFKNQELHFSFPKSFTGTLGSFNIDIKRRKPTAIKAAIIREKGVNGDREMAHSMHLAGMDVKDVHMTDLISGREALDEINMIVFVGGFSNSDVLGSAKGWAGAFLYNEKAKTALERFYNRPDTLSLGVCNGCQVMMELGLVVKDQDKKAFMSFNESHKFESAFLNVDILQNRSVMLGSLSGSRLGIWVAHGEGKFNLPLAEDKYHITMKYSYDQYPGNPNGSDYSTAGLCSEDGRHLVMMPHLERAIFPWNWAFYPASRKSDQVSPWIEAFVNAREWIQRNRVKS